MDEALKQLAENLEDISANGHDRFAQAKAAHQLVCSAIRVIKSSLDVTDQMNNAVVLESAIEVMTDWWIKHHTSSQVGHAEMSDKFTCLALVEAVQATIAGGS